MDGAIQWKKPDHDVYYTCLENHSLFEWFTFLEKNQNLEYHKDTFSHAQP